MRSCLYHTHEFVSCLIPSSAMISSNWISAWLGDGGWQLKRVGIGTVGRRRGRMSYCLLVNAIGERIRLFLLFWGSTLSENRMMVWRETFSHGRQDGISVEGCASRRRLGIVYQMSRVYVGTVIGVFP